MYTIAGATGQVGSATARALLREGRPIRVLVRDAAKGEIWARQGAEVAVADLADRAALMEALTGADGFFCLLPFPLDAADLHATLRAQRDAIAAAVADSGVPHVVQLSSIGAELEAGTGPIVELHHLEEQLRETPATVTAIRSPHFQEKVTEVLDVVRAEGIYPVFGSADVPVPMVATRDIGAVAARCLLGPPSEDEVIDLDGPRYSERDLARALAAALGSSVEVVEVPQEGWEDALVDAGFPPHIAQVLVGLHEAGADGRLVPVGDRTVRCTTGIEETLASVLGLTPTAAVATGGAA